MAKIIEAVPVGIRSIGTYFPKDIVTSEQLSEKSGIPESVIREKFGIISLHKAGKNEDTVSDMCVKAAKDCIKNVINPEDIDLLIYHGSEYRDFYLYNCSAHIQYKLGAVNAKTFEIHNLCSSGPIALQVVKSLMYLNPDIKNALLVVGTRESDVIDYTNQKARFMFNFGDGAAACLVQRGYEKNQILETELISDGRFAEDVAIFNIGNKNYFEYDVLYKNLKDVEEARKKGENAGYYGLDVKDPKEMKERLDPVSLKNFCAVIEKAAVKSGYKKTDIDFLAPIFMKKSILQDIVNQFNMSVEQSFILDHFGHVQSADAYISLEEGLKAGKIKDGDLVIMLGAGTGYSWAATAVKWG